MTDEQRLFFHNTLDKCLDMMVESGEIRDCIDIVVISTVPSTVPDEYTMFTVSAECYTVTDGTFFVEDITTSSRTWS